MFLSAFVPSWQIILTNQSPQINIRTFVYSWPNHLHQSFVFLSAFVPSWQIIRTNKYSHIRVFVAKPSAPILRVSLRLSAFVANLRGKPSWLPFLREQPRFKLTHFLRYMPYMIWCRTTTSAHNIYKPFLCPFFNYMCRFVWLFIVFSKSIW